MGLIDLLLGHVRVGSPTCAACGEAILGQHLIALERTWHAEHFRCGVCNKTLNGNFHSNLHGEVFCTTHPTEQVTCLGCERLVPQGNGPNGYPLCLGCAKGAIQADPVAVPALDRVQNFLRRIGLPWWPQRFPIHLVERQAFSRLTSRVIPGQMGMIRTSLIQNGARTERKVEEILVLRGLPEHRMEAIIAHELGHAWVFHKGLALPLKVEEGFCELCSYLWLNQQTDARTRILEAQIRSNTDPVYGDGFRQVFKVYERGGLQGVLAMLSNTANNQH